MTGHRSKLWVHVSAALLAVAVLAGPAHAQSDLGTRLDEAGQKLDSDTQNCRSVNLAEYAQLLQEAGKNKKMAQKAAKAGAPPNPQVDQDLGKAMMLFARAQAAQAMQCMRAAQQQAQPQARTVPQHSGMAPSTPSRAAPQGLTPGDEQAIARQQRTVEGFEEELKELEAAVKAGKCSLAWDIIDDLDDWLDELEGETPLLKPAGFVQPKVPLGLIDRWDERIDELIEHCPRPGYLNYQQVRIILETTNMERAKYGLDPLRWSFKLEGHAQNYADTLKRTGELGHAPREGRGTERENLSQGLPWWSVQQHLNAWRAEQKKFKPGIFPDVSFTGNWYEVGHWTQWIWAKTRAIGCGMAAGGAASWFVCRYNPGGNKDGVPVGMPVHEIAQPALPAGEVFNTVGHAASPPPAGKLFPEYEAQAIGGGPSFGSVTLDEFDQWLTGESGPRVVDAVPSPFSVGLSYTFWDGSRVIYVDTKVEQPKLPNTEPFKIPEPKPGDLDPS